MERGHPISYHVLAKGTPVETADGQEFGRVKRVLHVPAKDVFDGVVVKTADGDRFVDADEVDRIYENVLVLNVSAKAAALLPRPGDHPHTYAPSMTAPLKRSAKRIRKRLGL